MKQATVFLLFIVSFGKLHSQQIASAKTIMGSFTDDYGIRYTINDSSWKQLLKTTYHIIKWNEKEQYILAKNDTSNKVDKGLFTRIDYMLFENMAPYTWGFCLTVYDAATEKDAELTIPANRANPRKGCGGYPFSRMKKMEENSQ